MSLPVPQVLSEAMQQAITASEAASGRSTPNPPVGAVVLDTFGQIVGTGATEAPGSRHAEIVALDQAGDRARGGSLVVTLEPCNHTGRTGPCVERILREGLASVVYAVAEPSSTASGGAKALAAAGVAVHQFGQDAAAEGPLRFWLHRQKLGRPFVIWKYGASLDGKVAAADGSSQWITSTQSRAHAHRNRGRVDAILVGTQTCRADDPSLTARNPDGTLMHWQPRACVMGLTQVPEGAASRRSPGGFQHLKTRDPREALGALGPVQSVVLEGGPTLAGAFLALDLVDEIHAYIAPIVLGGGRNAVVDAEVATLSQAHRFDIHTATRLGPDLHLSLRPTKTNIGLKN